MLKKTFQDVIDQLDMFLHSPVGVMDSGGLVLASNSSEEMSSSADTFAEVCYECMKAVYCLGYVVCGIGKARGVEYIVYVKGGDAEAHRTCMMLAVSLANIRLCYDERYDKATFVKNVIQGNTLPMDLYQRARELGVEFDKRRVVLSVKILQEGDVEALDVFLGIFPEQERDFVFSTDESTIVLVREISEDTTDAELDNLAQLVIDNLNSEAMLGVLVAISTAAPNLPQLASAYKESQIALEIGRIFEGDKHILNYKNLGIGRLIYHLPTRLCHLFLQEVLTKRGFETLGEEMLATIHEFFKNDLNVSETARQLYIHRNTLVYRLDKILKTLGLDLRKFDQAIVFKVAMMVSQYLQSDTMKI